MKKFSLMAGLVALATVGSVFAAWQFTDDATAELKGNPTLNVEQTVTVNGLAGELELIAQGNEEITLDQTQANEYKYQFKDSNDEKYLVKYTPVYGEAEELNINITYYWSFIRNADPVQQQQPVSVQLEKQTDGSYSYEIPFGLVSGNISGNYPSNYTFEENTASLKEWLEGTFKVELKVQVNYGVV